MSELLTDEEKFHITSCMFVIGMLGIFTVKIITYIRLDLLSPIMQFIFFIIAIWSLIQSIKFYSKIKKANQINL